MLVSMKAVLDLADAKKIAVGAFNITSLEGIQAVLGAAEELGQPDRKSTRLNSSH